MVMQARKLPRLSDGYFDRNQSHSYETSGKYSKSSDKSEQLRGSPISTHTDVCNKNEIFENKCSPRYHRPTLQRLKDKDHHEDSNRLSIIKNEQKNNANKCDRDGSSEQYQSNHDRNTSEEAEKRLPQVVDWSEHISSSGKKYYYNCKTEVSQWEKPKELIEWERQQNLSRLAYDPSNRLKDHGNERQSSTSLAAKNSMLQESADNSADGGESEGVTQNRLINSGLTSTQVAATHLLSPSQVTMANLPKLISQLAGTKGLPNLSELSPQEALRTIQQALQLTQQVTNMSQATDSHHVNKPSTSPAQANHLSSSITGTFHSNSNQFPDVEVDRASPCSDSSTHSVQHESPTSSVSSLQSLGTSSLATGTLRPSVPSLTPSLANHYREDLISHVVGWQADHAERQANRYWEEAHNMGSLNCTQVSAELKMARALVRLAEIQATLQEQRILFLKQQTKELEEWRSLNSFMGDS